MWSKEKLEQETRAWAQEIVDVGTLHGAACLMLADCDVGSMSWDGWQNGGQDQQVLEAAQEYALQKFPKLQSEAYCVRLRHLGPNHHSDLSAKEDIFYQVMYAFIWESNRSGAILFLGAIRALYWQGLLTKEEYEWWKPPVQQAEGVDGL